MTVQVSDAVTGGDRSFAWLGDSEMAGRVGEYDWSSTPLGPISEWPVSLMCAVAICLRSHFEMTLYWGPELTCIYNDAERDVLGKLHPGALGSPACELLQDSWNVVGPQLWSVMREGEASWAVDRPLTFRRPGSLEVGYFTYSYSPVPDDQGEIGGVLLVSRDTTARVLAERRIDGIRELATRSIDVSTEGEACRLAAQTLAGTPDTPFVVIYLFDEAGRRAVCAASGGLSGLDPPPEIEVGQGTLGRLVRTLIKTRSRGMLVDTAAFADPHPTAPAAPRRAYAVPIARGTREPLAGVMVAGVTDDLMFDDSYRTFFEMAAYGLGRSVTAARHRAAERERAESERERARSIAALEQAKTALFNNASHDLRTPLALVLGHLEQVMDDVELPARHRESVEVAHRGAQRMVKLVNALLDFSRIEAGEQLGAFRPTDLARLTRDVAAMFESTAVRAGLRFTVDCPSLRAPVFVDPEAWERIVSNLVSNALKYTLSGGIEIRLREDQAYASMTVQDTGIGIASSDLDLVFSRFHRIVNARARTAEGAGIGLALVRELVHMHGGSIEAHSQPERGTRMIVRIPLGHEHLSGRMLDQRAGARPGGSASLLVAEANAWFGAEAGTPSLLPAARAAPRASGHSQAGRDRALVVEDSRDMQAYLRRLLAPHFAVQIARNGHEACELAALDPPRIVISDVMMPGMDGFGLVRELRRQPRTSLVPVILVSALADARSAEQAFRLGVDDFIVKPFSARELIARVEATIEAARLRSESAAASARAEEHGRAQHELRALLNELRAAQRRVVIAADAERSRIERDLHDGAQQRLVAIRLQLGLIDEIVETDPQGACRQLHTLRRDLDEALEEMRELAHGLYPPLLTSDGLSAALSAAARRAAIPVTIVGSEIERAPRPVETAAYFCCLEALQNAAKHAGPGARATIELRISDGVFEFAIRDDGEGFDAGAVHRGQGLTNLRDRLAALGGQAEIISAPGEGTTVLGQIPTS